MQFTGNYTSNDGGTTKTYEAIFNSGLNSGFIHTRSALNFNAYDNNSIVVNDGVDGTAPDKDNLVINTININNGRDGAHALIEAGGKAFSTVAFNSFVNEQSIIVHAGELHLGKFAGIGAEGAEDYVPATQANLNNSTITINAGALSVCKGS